MRKFFVLLLVFFSHHAFCQQLILDDGSDSLRYPTKDSLFKVSFRITGTRIGSIAKVWISTFNRGSAQKNVDYTLQGSDGVDTDTVVLNAKNYKGELGVFVRSGPKVSKTIILEILILDNGRSTFTEAIITLHPPIPQVEKKESKKDTSGLTLFNDIDINLYDKTGGLLKKRTGARIPWVLWLWKKKAYQTINIDSVSIGYTAPDKFKPIVYDTNGNIYFNQKDLTLKKIWDDNDRLYMKGDPTNNFIHLRDFLVYSIDPQAEKTLDIESNYIILPKN